ncbi:hypothetical protein [Maridesulfovibrio bastinii]|nr:hypothetical protein [Maridesulfovibrio bastinii]
MDPVRELYQLVEALETCRKVAPVGLNFLLGLLKEKVYQLAVTLEDCE